MTITTISWADGIDITTKEEALKFIDESSMTPKKDHKFFEENWDDIISGKLGSIVEFDAPINIFKVNY